MALPAPRDLAFASAAPATRRAPSMPRFFVVRTWASPRAPQSMSATNGTSFRVISFDSPCRSRRPPGSPEATGASVLLHDHRERRLTEKGLGPGAPDLDLGDVGDEGGNHDLLVVLVALDHQPLQQVGVPLGVHHLPVGRR